MKSIVKLSVLMFLSGVLMFASCKKKSELEPVSKLPVVSIDSVTNISLTTADVNADIFFNGGYSVTQKGICWGTNQNPTINDAKTLAGPGEDFFFGKMTGLLKGKVYYVRAYATNSEGTGYSEQQIVKAGTVTDIDGNVYDIVTINGKTWIAANLRVTKYNNGDPIPLVTNAGQWQKLTTGAYCYVNNSASTVNDYGLLYNFNTVLDPRGICPKGYRVVRYNELASLGGNGGALKSTGTNFWKSPNEGATNSTGFSAKGTGFRDSAGVYLEFNEITYFWDHLASTNGYVAWLDYDGASFTTNFWSLDRRYGLCVRCLKK